MTSFLTNPANLWRLFFLLLIMTAIFAGVMAIWDFEIIDEMSQPRRIVEHIEAMSATQRAVHAWMTGTLDVAYPFVYGALFAGLSLRAFDRWGMLLAIPSFLVIPVDLIEGFIQVLLLNGVYDIAWMKAYVTPLKFVLFGLGVVLSLFAVGVLVFKKWVRP